MSQSRLTCGEPTTLRVRRLPVPGLLSRSILAVGLGLVATCESPPSDGPGSRSADMGDPPDPMRCPATQAYERGSGRCVDLPTCTPTTLDVKFKKGPRSPDGWSAWTPDVAAPTVDLRAIWGPADSDAWIVGGAGTILGWQGLAWVPQASGTTADLNALWGANPCLIWAVGQAGTLLRYDGSAWTSQSSGTTKALHGIWGSDAYDIWLVGEGGTLLHFDGQRWSSEASGTTRDLYAIWGTGHTNIWAAGQNGLLLHYDGMVWSDWVSATPQTLRGIWGEDARHIWAVGHAGAIVYFDGQKWTDQSSHTTQDLLAIHGPTIVGAGGYLLERTNPNIGWFPHTYGVGDWLGTWGGSLERRWAVGRDGAMLRFRGDFQYFGSGGGPSYGPPPLDGQAVFGTSAANVWVSGGSGLAVRWDGTAWMAHRSGSGKTLAGLWGDASNNVWAIEDSSAGESRFFRWNGTQWQPSTSAASRSIGSLFGSAADEIWAAGSPLLKWNGSAWTQPAWEPAVSPRKGFGLDGKNVWLAGTETEVLWGHSIRDTGYIWFWNGTRWTQAFSAAVFNEQLEINGIWASDPTNVWVVGVMGRGSAQRSIWKLEGGRLTAVSSPVNTTLHGICGSAGNHVFAVGDAGTLLRWDGSALLQQNINGYVGNLYAVWAADGKNAWAVGEGVILQHD